MNDFYKRFESFDDEKLLNMVLYPDDYQSEAIEAARSIIVNRGLEEELALRLNERDIKKEVEEQKEFDEVVAKAKHYKDIVEFKQHRIFFNIKTSDVPKFESDLIKYKIPFHCEDQHIGAQLDTYPTQRYYFKREDANKVDEIVKSLELVTAPYTDIKPFFKFEFIVLLLAILLFIIWLLYLVSNYSLNRSMEINRVWHEKHRMPKNANFDQRVKWHLEHQKYCQCRPIPPKLLEQMKATGIKS